jgi:hypothetical protein
MLAALFRDTNNLPQRESADGGAQSSNNQKDLTGQARYKASGK